MADVGAPQQALELGDQFELAFQVFVGRMRGFEVARVGQAIGADRPQVRQAHQAAEVLADIAACLAIGQLDAKAHPARDHRDLLRLDLDHAELGEQAQAAVLGHDQQFAVGVVEIAAVHVGGGRIQMDADASLGSGAAVAAHRVQAIDEIGRRLR